MTAATAPGGLPDVAGRVARTTGEELVDPRTPMRVALGIAQLVGGIVLVLLGSMVLLHRVPTLACLAIVVIGLVLLYRGVAAVGRAILGSTWDAGLWLSLGWIAIVVLAAVLAPLLPLQEAEDASLALTAPVMAPLDLSSVHPLGTNALGLDVLARLVFGARVSLTVSVAAVLIGVLIGGLIGIVSGYLRGPLDTVVDIFVNAVLAFPALVLLIAAAAVLPRSVLSQTILFGVLAVPFMTRLVRANTLAVSQREFVTAASSYGASTARILVREVLPTVALTMATYAVMMVAVLMVAEASVSFLGLGLEPPKASWGGMIAEGQNGVFEEHPSIVFIPSTALFLTVFSLNLVGYRLRRRFLGEGSR